MEKKQDGRRDVVMTDVEDLVPKDHLLRKIENFSRFGRILLLFSSTIAQYVLYSYNLDTPWTSFPLDKAGKIV